MEDGELETLAQTLPRDLTEFVVQNNNDFRDECIKWDKELEERKRLEEVQRQQQEAERIAQQSSETSAANIDPTNDVLVRNIRH